MIKTINIEAIQAGTRTIVTWGDGRRTILRVLQGNEFIEVTWLNLQGKRRGQTLGFKSVRDVQKWFTTQFIEEPRRKETTAIAIQLKEV